MKKEKYYMYARTGRNAYAFIEAEGYKRTIDGVSFYLTKFTGYGWKVTEATTGLSIMTTGTNLKTLEQAFEYCERMQRTVKRLLNTDSNIEQAKLLEEYKAAHREVKE